MNRRRTNRRRMLCPTCRTLENVTKIEGDCVHLGCGDTRTYGLLPSTGVSLEDIILGTDDSIRLFPVDLRGMVR